MVRAAEPQELDIHALLRLFVSKVQNGAPATYATFRETWQEMKFSFIYEGCKERHLSQDYISWLLAAAADHFWAPLPKDPCKRESAEAAGAIAPATGDVRGSDTLVLQLPGIGEATEATDRGLTTVQEAAERAESSVPGRMPDIPEISLPQPIGGSDLQHEAALLLPPTDMAAGPSGPSPTAMTGHSQTIQLDENSLLALLMDNDEMDALEPDQQILAALEVPGSGSAANTAAANDGGDRPSFALKAGALYTIYTIHKTQPAYKGRRVRAYLPVSSLQAISDMLPEARQRQIPDIPSIVRCLVQEQAFVIGGVRRPPAGHQIVRDGPVRMAQVDMSERNAMQPMTMRHLANTQLALRELKHVQLLCDSYSKAQRSVFAAADPEDMPPSIADLGMGERFRDLARQITLDVHGALSGASAPLSKKQKLAEHKAAQAAAAAAAAEAQNGGSRAARKPAGDLQANVSDMGGLPSMAKAVERQKGLEQAEILLKQREWAERGARALAAAEDMPDDLGHPARQEETLARAGGEAAADSVVTAPAAAEAAAAVDIGQPAEPPQLAAAAARPAHDHSGKAHGNILLNGSGLSEQERHATAEDPAGKRTAAQALASAFGEDSDSSSMDSMDHHDAALQQPHEHLEAPASTPDKPQALSRPSKQKVGALKKHSTRGGRSRGEADSHKAPLVSRAKRKAAAAEDAAEHAGNAKAQRRPAKASEATKRSKEGQSTLHRKESIGKPVLVAGGMRAQNKAKASVKASCARAGPGAVAPDWKAYAEVLDVRLAEAEALLADDSE